ncbi:phage baseplate assembly protein V [Azospirillum sp. SYSU D00513]|uniref:phage baseplate assembly protein V n=1 Tax=Azospirillum sp. SYSU D00513 TaxID=2812561 RepID=UPI001A95CCDD|nr:phage baseplate assembly protein V [Azospirillum sp. SYSU D00513]
MDNRPFSKLAAPLKRGLDMMLARAVLTAVSSGKMQVVQVNILAGETKDGVEHFEPYGWTSHPLPGAEAVVGFVGGDRSHGMAVVIADRRHRPSDLKPGEVCVHDDLKQEVRLTREGIVIKGAGLPITIEDTPKVRMETPLLEVTGEVRDRCDSDGRTMAEMREVYNGHTHPENDGGGPTSSPNQGM